jgi:cytoskeleton protein RodZ
MTEAQQTSSAAVAPSAGTTLREAREAMGLAVDELAAMLKVMPAKIEALEADRHSDFPDPVFARALAQSLCRTLKIDAAPVLALLPRTPGQRLDKIHVGLNAQYREGPASSIIDDWSGIAKPLLWGPALLVVAAVAIYFFPTGWFNPPKVSPRVVTAAPAASGTERTELATAGGTAASAPMVGETTRTSDVQPPSTIAPPPQAQAAAVPHAAAAPTPPPAAPVVTPAATTTAADALAQKPVPAASGVLQLRTSADSWIEVQDARGVMLLSRGLEAGEAVGLNGAMPLKVTLGNVRATQVVFRGKAMDLAMFTRDNIARFELK